MKPITYSVIFTLFLSLFTGAKSYGQTFGTNASAVWISDCNQSNFFNTSGLSPNLIGPSGNVFSNSNFGVHTQNSGSLVLRGGEVRTFKVAGVSNVCSVRMYYRVYPQSGIPGAFTAIDLPFIDDCNIPGNQFPSGGICIAGEQKWNRVIADGTAIPYAPVNLTPFPAGNYTLEIYYDVSGSSTSTTLCDETILLNNAGNNYKASFSIQAPTLASTNPVTCNGMEGAITINGLAAGATYSISYTDDGVPVTANNYVANGSGQVIISGLNAGVYSDFDLVINGCTTALNTGVILSNPVVTPTFSSIAPFCEGTTPPVLPTTSINGINGSWNPSVINNSSSASYVFTPATGQCALPATRNVTVIPRVIPTFSFGTSLTICAGASVPVLPTTSVNSITGTWSASVIDNQNSAAYTFTPTPGLCASPTTFAVTVTPNITPTFNFGTSLSICAGASVPALPSTSSNNISGTWNPSVVDDQNSGTYTFTPALGVCATVVTFAVTVTPNTIPTFSFGTSLSICAGAAVPSLPVTSLNGVSGSWSPASVDNQSSATYTFTPGGGCATTASFVVSVAPNIIPTFSFATSLTICAGVAVPSLPSASDNGINGIWSPSTIDDQNSGTYTFTPSAGQCATTASFAVTVNPIITPSFSFGTSLAICAGSAVPVLPATSSNGITGTWSPSAVDNQNSGTYTFSPTAGQCASTTSFTVTVSNNNIPTFSFGTTLTVCAGAAVPSLPATSDNGINGSWSPASVDNQNSGTYTFTPAAGQCALTVTFTVTVNPNITPTFSFGTTLNICAGANVPALPSTSGNGITGTWSPSSVDNQNSATYTFTPSAGLCATNTTFTVTVNPNITPTFSFGSSLTICSGSNVPALPNTSLNNVTGTWSPSIVSNQNSGTYTFTPSEGQCATTTTFTVTVTPTITPVFDFGTSLIICTGGTVPLLPATSTNGINGTWSAAIVDNQASGVYTFTPAATPEQCIAPVTFTVTVNPILTPTFSFGTATTICAGSNAPVLPATSTNGVSGTWSPASINNQASGTYTFTSTAGQCAVPLITLNVTVTPVATISVRADTTVNDGANFPATNFSATPQGASFSWTNSNTAIGLAASGTGNVPSFTAVNKGATPITATITVTPSFNNCAGTSRTYVITVRPLDKDVFVPNVFTPNGDGKNDVLLVYGNYIDRIEMRIFNQWGEMVQMVNNKTRGWDGTQRGKPQPVGVYVYELQAWLSDGRTVKLKGYITLLR